MKRAIMGMLAAAAFGAGFAWSGVAQAGDESRLGMMGSGYVVPGVTYIAAHSTSAVGVTNICTATVDVYWAITKEDDTEAGRGRFTVQPHQTYPFILASELPLPSVFYVGEFGTLILAGDVNRDGALTVADPPCLAVEAFHAEAALNDAVFLPAWPFDMNDLAGTPPGISSLDLMSPDALSTLHSGVVDPPGVGSPTLFFRYSVGGGDTTYFMLWSAEDIQGLLLYAVATNYDGQVDQFFVEMENAHLNVIPASILGLPAGFTNGTVYWQAPDDGVGDYFETGGDGNGMALYSVIQSPALGATQTILGLGR